MGFMENLKGQVGAALGNLATQHGGMAASAMALINEHPGGLSGLVQTFEAQGLGGVVSSWVGTGTNQPITAAQIQQVLGNEKLQAFATQHGIDVNQVSTQLATLLPQLVDQLTPHGTVPPAAAAPATPGS